MSVGDQMRQLKDTKELHVLFCLTFSCPQFTSSRGFVTPVKELLVRILKSKPIKHFLRSCVKNKFHVDYMLITC